MFCVHRPFHCAASQGHAECIAALVRLDPLAALVQHAIKDNDGSTALHLAATAGRIAAVRAFLDSTRDEGQEDILWAPVTQHDRNRMTPLHCAIVEGHASTVRQLVRWCAAHATVEAVASQLLGPSAEASYANAFHIAATAGQAGCISAIQEELWSKYAEDCAPHTVRLLGAPDADGLTPLHRACTRGHASCLQALDFCLPKPAPSASGPGTSRGYPRTGYPLARARGVCALDGQGRNGLHLAAAGGHVAVLHELLRIGIPVCWLLWKDHSNGLPTQYAAHHGQVAFLVALAQATQRRPQEFSEFPRPSAAAANEQIEVPSWRRPVPHADWADLQTSLPPSLRCGSLLQELAVDCDISEEAKLVASKAAAHFVTAAYQRLAFAAIFQSGSASHVAGGVAAAIDESARLPRAGGEEVLRKDDVTVFEDVDVAAGWVEVLLPSLRSLVGAGYARSEVALRFAEQGGWAWRRSDVAVKPDPFISSFAVLKGSPEAVEKGIAAEKMSKKKRKREGSKPEWKAVVDKRGIAQPADLMPGPRGANGSNGSKKKKKKRRKGRGASKIIVVES